MVMIFDLKQLTREANKIMGETTMIVVSLTKEAQTTSILQRDEAKCYSIPDMQILRSEIRDGISKLKSILSKRGNARDGSTFEELWCLYMEVERVGCVCSVICLILTGGCDKC